MCAHRSARDAGRSVAPQRGARAGSYPSAGELTASEWAGVQKAFRHVTRSATVAGLMALSGAMFGGCMPAVRNEPPPAYQATPSQGQEAAQQPDANGETDISEPPQQ